MPGVPSEVSLLVAPLPNAASRRSKANMKTTILILLSLFITGAFAQTNTCQYLFRIPVYPNMEPAGTFSSHIKSDPPFLTRLKVYKPKEGAQINKDDVIQFYKDFYSRLDWKSADRKQESDFPYLQMQITLNTQHNAEFQLWISPDGELVTIYMDERRSSCFPSASFKEYRNIITTVAAQNGLEIRKTTPDRGWIKGWEQYYENEYLKVCESYSFYSNSRKSGGLSGCVNSSGRFSAVLLLYKNEASAKEQKETWDREASKYKHQEMIDNGDGTGVIRMRSWWNGIVIQDENILVKIDNRDKNQTNLVSKVATEIEGYSNQRVHSIAGSARSE